MPEKNPEALEQYILLLKNRRDRQKQALARTIQSIQDAEAHRLPTHGIKVGDTIHTAWDVSNRGEGRRVLKAHWASVVVSDPAWPKRRAERIPIIRIKRHNGDVYQPNGEQ